MAPSGLSSRLGSLVCASDENISKSYELHICTFGARNYAHTIAQYLDPTGKFFSHRILSRDECFNITGKMDNLKALFPFGDSMGT